MYVYVCICVYIYIYITLRNLPAALSFVLCVTFMNITYVYCVWLCLLALGCFMCYALCFLFIVWFIVLYSLGIVSLFAMLFLIVLLFYSLGASCLRLYPYKQIHTYMHIHIYIYIYVSIHITIYLFISLSLYIYTTFCFVHHFILWLSMLYVLGIVS